MQPGKDLTEHEITFVAILVLFGRTAVDLAPATPDVLLNAVWHSGSLKDELTRMEPSATTLFILYVLLATCVVLTLLLFVRSVLQKMSPTAVCHDPHPA